jgi:hypothetical protein
MDKIFENWGMSDVVSYCTISTNSSVTGHSDPQREDLDDLSQVTTVIEEMDINFLRHRRTNYWLPENLLKRCPGCHTSSQVPKRCSSLRGGHRSQGVKSRSKWYSIHFLWTTLKPKKAISAFGNRHKLLQVPQFFRKTAAMSPSLSNPQGLYNMVYKCMECAGGKNPNRT